MKNNKFDVINYDVPKFQVSVEFKYHTYDEETEDIHPVNDFDINLKKDNINMFLSNKITINLHDLRERLRFDSNISFLSNINENVVETIQGLQNSNLNEKLIDNTKVIDFFNSNLKFNDKSINLISGLDNKFKKRILDAYDINQNKYENLIKFNQRNVSYSSNYLADIMQHKSSSNYAYDFKNAEFLSDINQLYTERINADYLSKNISVSTDKIDKLFENKFSDKQVLNISENLPLLLHFKALDITPLIEDQAQLKNETGVAFIGFLIKKHIKNVQGETFLDTASQFVYVNINDDTSLDQITLYDNLLNYANSYAYEISPVFYLGLYRYFGYRQFNFPLITHHLVYSSSQNTSFVRAVDYYTPEPPNGLQARFRSKMFKAELSWEHPTNPQGDVIGFQIYRRSKLEEPFQLIKVYLKKKMSEFKHMQLFSDVIPDNLIEVSPNNSLINMYSFIDHDVDLTKETYIYAICSIDAHGYVSNYSTQIGLRYSKIYNSLLIDQVSMQNAPRSYPNLYVQRKSRLFENDDLIFDFTPNFKNKEKIKVYFTPDVLNLKDNINNKRINVFDINNEYQLSVSRLNDLSSKSIKFKLNLP